MMRREHLKDGTWVDLRGEEEVTQKGRRGIQAIASGLSNVLGRPDITKDTTMAELGLTEEQTDAMIRMQEATVVAFLLGWEKPEPLPTLATIGDLPSGLFDELAELTAKEGASLALDTSPSLEVDPKDHSGNSASLVGPLKDDRDSEKVSIQTLPSDGSLSVTAS